MEGGRTGGRDAKLNRLNKMLHLVGHSRLPFDSSIFCLKPVISFITDFDIDCSSVFWVWYGTGARR